MRLREWTITLPADMIDSREKICDHAIDVVRDDIADDYCIPALWQSWLIGSDATAVSVCVTRLSQGGPFPTMQSGAQLTTLTGK